MATHVGGREQNGGKRDFFVFKIYFRTMKMYKFM